MQAALDKSNVSTQTTGAKPVANAGLYDMRKARPGLNEVGSLTPQEVKRGVSNQFGNLDENRLTNLIGKTHSADDLLSPNRGRVKNETLEVYRVVPKGKNIFSGDFVFDTKVAAERFMANKPSGTSEIKKITAKLDDLISPTSPATGDRAVGELIYSPRDRGGNVAAGSKWSGNVSKQLEQNNPKLVINPSPVVSQRGQNTSSVMGYTIPQSPPKPPVGAQQAAKGAARH